MMTTAYWGGLIAHLKDAPKLNQLLLKPRPASSPKQSWQAIKAALQVALPPTEDDTDGR